MSGPINEQVQELNTLAEDLAVEVESLSKALQCVILSKTPPSLVGNNHEGEDEPARSDLGDQLNTLTNKLHVVRRSITELTANLEVRS